MVKNVADQTLDSCDIDKLCIAFLPIIVHVQVIFTFNHAVFDGCEDDCFSGLCSSLPFSPITNCQFYFQFEFRKIIDTCHSCWCDTNIEDPIAPRDRGRPIIPTWLVHIDKLFYTIFFVLIHFITITITDNSSYFQILRPSENPAKITREGDQEKQPAKLGPFMTRKNYLLN